MSSLLHRLYQYQKERFPLMGHGLMIVVFSFSAIAFSRVMSGYEDFINAKNYMICVFNNLTLFFILRVADEHKDHEDDRKYRQYLPVIRGLVSLAELKYVALTLLGFIIIIDFIFCPKLLILLFLVLVYLFLMLKEFYVPKWLKSHHTYYVVSHMMIIPIVDVFSTSFDWYLQGRSASYYLIIFFVISFINGLILEVGRKIRVMDNEEEGVLTYSKLWGYKRAIIYWLILVIICFVLSIYAIMIARHDALEQYLLFIVFLVCIILSANLYRNPSEFLTKKLEILSGIWTLIMYLSIGGLSMLSHLIKSIL